MDVMFCKSIKRYMLNRKIKKLNKSLTAVPDIKSYLVLENKRLDLMAKLNKVSKKK